MRAWLAIQLFGACLGALSGLTIGFGAKTIFQEMFGALTFGFSTLMIAVIVVGQLADSRAKANEILLREIRDAVREFVPSLLAAARQPPTGTGSRPTSSPPPATSAGLSPGPAPAPQAGTGAARAASEFRDGSRRHKPFGMRECPNCGELVWHDAKVCSSCHANLPPA